MLLFYTLAKSRSNETPRAHARGVSFLKKQQIPDYNTRE